MQIRLGRRAPAAALAIIALLGPLAGVGWSAPTQQPDRSEVRKTHLTIRVASCRGCTITVFGDYRDGDHHWSARRKLKFIGGPYLLGQVQFFVPSRNTRGLAVLVDDPHAVNTNAHPVAVMRYHGLAVGARVPDVYSGDGLAYACWAGTRKPRATLTFDLAQFSETDFFTGELGYAIAPFLGTGVRTTGAPQSTYPDGRMETQDPGSLCN